MGVAAISVVRESENYRSGPTPAYLPTQVTGMRLMQHINWEKRMTIRAVVFDFGGVLFDWSPQHLYRKRIADDHERQWFLDHICTQAWNTEQDAGRSLAEGTRSLIYHASLSQVRAQLPDIQPSEVVFIDDVAGNIEAAIALGWQGIHHVSAARTAAQLRELGVGF